MGQSSLTKSKTSYRLSVFSRFKDLNFQEKERRLTMAIVWLLLFAVTIATVQSTVGTEASEREDLDLNFSVVDYIEANANATEKNAKEIQRLSSLSNRLSSEIQKLKDAWRMCQTGRVLCTSCGGRDPDPEKTVDIVERSVQFSPHFVGTPSVSMATSYLYLSSPEGADSWGFESYPSSITASGFTAYLYLIDAKIETLGANWIACGKVNV